MMVRISVIIRFNIYWVVTTKSYCSKLLAHINLLNPHKLPYKVGPIFIAIKNWGKELISAYSRSHSNQVAETGFKPRKADSRVCSLTLWAVMILAQSRCPWGQSSPSWGSLPSPHTSFCFRNAFLPSESALLCLRPGVLFPRVGMIASFFCCCFLIWPCGEACQNLVSWPGIEPMAPAFETES